MTAPLVLWAQRADRLLLTVELEDCENPEIKLDKEQLYFKGKSHSIQSSADHGEHEVTIKFYKPINPDESKHVVRARGTEFVIMKEESAWWPRLMEDSTKRHWLKIDFGRWKDEDETDDEFNGDPMGMGGLGGQPDFSQLMSQFGGMGGGGPGGDFDGEEDDEEDDDDIGETGIQPPELEEEISNKQ